MQALVKKLVLEDHIVEHNDMFFHVCQMRFIHPTCNMLTNRWFILNINPRILESNPYFEFY